ncbi:hypothetical protein ACTFIR_002825 [Dictyostelium discoideum]
MTSSISKIINSINKKNGEGGIIYSIKRFLSIIGFCCCFLCTFDNESQDYRENEMKEPMTKIRLGFRGKDTWINAEGVNFHQTFGVYSVLLDEDDQVIPLTKNGELFEPLDTSKKYKIVANRYGSSESKWKQHKQKEKDTVKNYSILKKQKKKKQIEFLKQFNEKSQQPSQQQLNQPFDQQLNQQPEQQPPQQQLSTDIEINDDITSYPIEVETVNNNNNNNNNVIIPHTIENNIIVKNIKKDFTSDNKFFT